MTGRIYVARAFINEFGFSLFGYNINNGIYSTIVNGVVLNNISSVDSVFIIISP